MSLNIDLPLENLIACELAAELVRLKVDVIVTLGPAPTRAAKEATATIPIVMTQDPDPADAADKVRISISNLSGQFMTYPLAHRRGFLKEEGIEAEIIRVTGGAASAAMSSGDLDYGTGMAVGGAITGALPVKVVACFVPAPVFALVSRPEVKSVEELKDKTVGISTFSGLSIFGARVIAKHFGLDPDKDLKFVAIGAVEAAISG